MAINHVGPYQVVREIGEGGFAKVYECKAPDGRQVAVKLRQYGEEKRFRKEANLMLSMRHRGVVRVLDSGRDEETVQLYTVMEYIPYPTLATILAHEGKLPEHTTVTILKRIAEALDYVYRHSDVAAHRDIKPGNIFVKLNGDRVEEVKVTDFGIYRTTQGMGTFAAMGDPEYNPPEQIQNAGNYSAATDVYSLG
ncbi:MAG: serine/threonine protein kinase, partial [Verrucomicrobiota bacterium]